MSSVQMSRLLQSLRFRLPAGSLAGFLVALVLAWLLSSHLLTLYLADQMDRTLETEVLDVSAALDRYQPLPSPEISTGELERFGHTRGIDKAFYRLFDLEGRPLAQSDLSAWSSLQPPPLDRIQENFFTWQTLKPVSGQTSARVVWFRNPDGYLLQIGMDLSDSLKFQAWGGRIFAGMFLFVAVFGSILGWLAISKPLGGIREVVRVSGHISGEMNFEHRVNHPTGSLETDQLAHAFNTMLARIQVLVSAQREIMDNIAHDIRSPVARMRAAAERALNGANEEELPGRIVEDCDNILHLTNLLLEISVTQAGLAVWQPELLNLAQLVEDAAEMFAPLIEDHNLSLELDLDLMEDAALVRADRKVLQRIVSNLLDNAIKYSPPGQTIRISLKPEGSFLCLSILNSGVAIPAELCDRIFDRFYRLDASRSCPGSGLGLSFCRAAIIAMGGEIRCVPQEGAVLFSIHLPTRNLDQRS